jgi:Cytidylate kinase-like family
MAIVSVSREEGTWGGDVARDLASRLGYRLLDKKALLEEAEAYGGINEAAPELLERQPGLLERLDNERRRYSILLRTVVFDVALRDNVVFLGRGAGTPTTPYERSSSRPCPRASPGSWTVALAAGPAR